MGKGNDPFSVSPAMVCGSCACLRDLAMQLAQFRVSFEEAMMKGGAKRLLRPVPYGRVCIVSGGTLGLPVPYACMVGLSDGLGLDATSVFVRLQTEPVSTLASKCLSLFSVQQRQLLF